MKSLHKRILAAVVVLAVLISLFGCRGKIVIEDADCFESFMDLICSFDFEEAYKYLSEASTTMPAPTPEPTPADDGISVSVTASPEPTPLPTNFIKAADFAKKYRDIFDGLEISSVSYEKLEERVSGNDLIVRFRMTYVSGIAGELTNEYEMRLVTDGLARRVDWSPALIFPDMDWGYTVRVSTVPARRGDILAEGELLAETVTLNAISVDKEAVKSLSDTAAQIAEAIGEAPADILAVLNKSTSSKAVAARINDHDLTADMREALDGIEGVTVIENYGTDRVYPKGSLLAHTIGYVGYVEEKDVASLNEGRERLDGLYDVHSIVGRSGLERSYEKALRGKDGLSITIRDGEGEYVSTLFRKPVEHGMDVHISIDLSLQQRAEEVMDLVLWGDDTAGAVVVMNPKSGEVKALASYPTYDLNKLAISADPDYYEQLTSHKNNPLNNRTTLGLYPPGSAIKSFTASAALELGRIYPDTVFTGEIENDYWTPSTFGRWNWPPIKRTHVNNRSEPLNMENAMLYSDNIYFAYLALLMGEDDLLGYLRSVGFEQSMPFDLSVAKSTLKVKYDSEEYWNPRSIAETGYGQGQVTITPIQLATMYCTFRNGGNIPVPRLASALYATDGVDYKPVEVFEPATWIEGAVKTSTIATLLPMMKNIMSPDYNGTGRYLRARGCTVAGKTGTAEIGSDKSREISWFVGFRVDVPEEDELLVLVLIEIPTTDPYKNLKFDIARELISMG